MKNMLSMNPSSSNPARPSELTKYFKGGGTWWRRKYYFNIKSAKQIPFRVPPPPRCQKMLQHPAELQRRATWGGQRSKQTKYQYWNSHMHTKKPKQTCGELNGLCLTCFVTAAVQCVWFAPPCSPCAHQASCTSSTAHVQRGFTSKRCASLNILLPTWKIAAKESMIRIHHILCVKLREARR